MSEYKSLIEQQEAQKFNSQRKQAQRNAASKLRTSYKGPAKSQKQIDAEASKVGAQSTRPEASEGFSSGSQGAKRMSRNNPH